MYRIDGESGRVVWKYPTGARIRSSPAVANGVVYVGNFDGVFSALDARSGKLRWKYATEGASIDLAKWGFDRRSIDSSPSVADGVVTFGSRDAHQYGLDAATGRLLWRFAHPTDAPPHDALAWCEGSPAADAGVSFVGSSDGHFVNAIELRTGREIWRHATPERVIGSPALSGDLVVFGCEDGNVFAVDRKDGSLVWSFPTRARVYSSPAIARSTVLVGSADGGLWALSDRRPGATFVPRRAVYGDEKLAGWYQGAAVMRDYLASEGFERLDAASLPRFLEERIGDGVPSAVVFASDEPPLAATAADAGGTPLIRRYLESGGRVVWVGFPPFALKVDETTGKRTGLDPPATRRLLGVGRDSLDSGQMEDQGAIATPEGIELGMAPNLLGGFPVPAADVDVVLARDRDGFANAWIKRVGAGEFIRLWGLREPMKDLEAVRRLAEHGLSGAIDR